MSRRRNRYAEWVQKGSDSESQHVAHSSTKIKIVVQVPDKQNEPEKIGPGEAVRVLWNPFV